MKERGRDLLGQCQTASYAPGIHCLFPLFTCTFVTCDINCQSISEPIDCFRSAPADDDSVCCGDDDSWGDDSWGDNSWGDDSWRDDDRCGCGDIRAGHSSDDAGRAVKSVSIGNESVPIQLAQCRFPGLAVSNAKISIYIFQTKRAETILSNSTRKLLWFEYYQIDDCSLRKKLLCRLL